MKYDVLFGQQVVGYVELSVRGLYYHIRCHCQLRNEVLRLVDRCEKGQVQIGVCCPENGGMGISKSIPVKMLGTGDHQFILCSEKALFDEFLPVAENKPFSGIGHLEQYVFEERKGVPGLILNQSPGEAQKNPSEQNRPG